MAPRCRAAGQRLEFAGPPAGAATWVLADPDLVAGILAHLLDNAQRFSPPGAPVRLRVRGVADRVVLEVADRGPGIALQHRARILRKYAQVDRRDGPGEQGLGLGLAIVSRLLELHDSRLDLLSTPGLGSIFGFSLPAYTEAGHLRAFCVDALRQLPRRWEPWRLALVAAADGGPLPDWLPAAVARATTAPEPPMAELDHSGRPVLAVLMRDSDPGPAAWLGVARAAGSPPAERAEVVWTVTTVDHDGTPGPIAATTDWNIVEPEAVPRKEGAWR